MLPKKTAVILATGPSLTPEVLEVARRGRELGAWALYGMNRTYRDVPELDTFLACNKEFYELEWERGLKEHRAVKWHWDLQTCIRFGLNFIPGKWGDGFPKEPIFIHLGHSSGFQLPQLAYHAGFRRLLLCGYDMRYAKDYDGRNQRIGSSPRHYFGEYAPELQHWPSVKIRDGVFVELIEQFEKVKRLNPDVEIINCSPGSAMDCFPMSTLEEQLEEWETSSQASTSFAPAG
jgi:hypothetical protein